MRSDFAFILLCLLLIQIQSSQQEKHRYEMIIESDIPIKAIQIQGAMPYGETKGKEGIETSKTLSSSSSSSSLEIPATSINSSLLSTPSVSVPEVKVPKEIVEKETKEVEKIKEVDEILEEFS